MEDPIRQYIHQLVTDSNYLILNIITDNIPVEMTENISMNKIISGNESQTDSGSEHSSTEKEKEEKDVEKETLLVCHL